MSRLEQIMTGQYSGQPLSRLESLLLNGGLGGGCDCDPSDMIQLNNRINGLANRLNVGDQNMQIIEETLAGMNQRVSSNTENIEKLPTSGAVQNMINEESENVKNWVTNNAITTI